jgi:hypothetical protein
VSPCLKGRGPFIIGRRLECYKLIISIFSISDLRWSVHRGRLEASTVSRPVLEPSGLSFSVLRALQGSEVNDVRVGL